MKIKNIFDMFNKKIDAVIVVDIGSNLKLINVELRPEVKISALKVIKLANDKKEEIILNALRNFIQENNIQHKNAILRPLLKSVFIKRLQLPAMPYAELPEAIKWQLKKEEVAFDLTEAVFDFFILKETLRPDGAKALDVVCVIAQEKEIKPQVLLLKQAGLNCLVVVPLAFGYANIVARYIPHEKDEPIGILHIEDDASFITIHKEKKIEFFRELPISINKLREALAGTLVTDRGKVSLTKDDINSILFEHGIPLSGSSLYKDKLAEKEALAMLRPTLERLTQEIKRSLLYYESQFQGEKIKKILVGGLAAGIPNLDRFLTQDLSLDIQKISLADKVKVASNIDVKALSEYSATLGLALDYGAGTNLLPHEFRTEKIERFQKVSLRWVAFLAILLLAVSYIFAKAGVSAYQKRLDNALLHLNVLSEIKQIKTDTDEFNKFISEISSQDLPITVMLKKLSSIAGKELFLDNFSLNYDTKAVIIAGFIKSFNRDCDIILTKFVHNMEGSAYFIDANIVSVEKASTAGVETLKFNLTFKLP